jgi:WD40 repeat protein
MYPHHSVDNCYYDSNILEELPDVIWETFLLPFLDRKDWNNVVCLCKGVRTKFVGRTPPRLTKTTNVNNNDNDSNRITGRDNNNDNTDHHNNTDDGVDDLDDHILLAPPWPERCFTTKNPNASTMVTNGIITGGAASGGGSIESFAVSSDGEYLAYGSMLGNIQLWNRRTGCVRLLAGSGSGTNSSRSRRKRRGGYGLGPGGDAGGGAIFGDLESSPPQPLPGDEDYKRGSAGAAESFSDHHASRLSMSMVGTIIKFSPVGHVLACGFENSIRLWDISSVSTAHADVSTTEPPPLPIIQTIEIDQKSSIYEVTFLDFSHDMSRLVVRYGKTAFIYGLKATQNRSKASTQSSASLLPPTPAHPSSPSYYTFLYRIPLSSSRCTMAISPCLRHLAVAHNGSSGNLDEKGSLDIWMFYDQTTFPHGTDSLCFDDDFIATDDDTEGVIQSLSYRIDAHKGRQVIRGLEFYPQKRGLVSTRDNHPWLISATLQGQIKVWMYHESIAEFINKKRYHDQNLHDENANDEHVCTNASCEDDVDNSIENMDSHVSPYVCLYSFQAAGKIFSMAISSSLSSPYLAVGQARGQVRIWKMNIFDQIDTSGEKACSSSTASSQRQSVSLEERLAMCNFGEHAYHDNIKLIQFTPDGRHIIASRAYDGKIYFRAFPHT